MHRGGHVRRPHGPAVARELGSAADMLVGLDFAVTPDLRSAADMFVGPTAPRWRAAHASPVGSAGLAFRTPGAILLSSNRASMCMLCPMLDLRITSATEYFEPIKFCEGHGISGAFWQRICSAPILLRPLESGVFRSGTLDFAAELRDALTGYEVEVINEDDSQYREYALHCDSLTLPSLLLLLGANGVPANIFSNFLWDWIKARWALLKHGKKELSMDLYISTEEKFGYKQTIRKLTLSGPAESFRPEAVLAELNRNLSGGPQ